MVDINKLDDLMYISKYIKHSSSDYNMIWDEIRNNLDILNEAIIVKRNKFDEKDIFNHLAIVEAMLMFHDKVDKDVYQKLINLIYSNTDLSRIVLNGASNGGFSFLLLTLFNANLVFSEEQKEFAVSEAMNQVGTSLWYKKQEKYSEQLEDKGITDDETVYIDNDGCINPIGLKSGCEYIYYMNSKLSNTLAHGRGVYDIRYYILRNSNWTLEEKEKLIFEFFKSDETYDYFLEQWEWGIINDKVNYINSCVPVLDKDYLYEYNFGDLVELYECENVAKYIYDEIQFCKLMHHIRPQIWEKEIVLKK